MASVIQGEFGWSNAPFIAGMREAERVGNNTAKTLEGKFQSLFKRSPGQRGERAVSALIGDLAGGNVSQGIAQFASRISGLGLGIGIAIGAGVAVFEQLRAKIKDTQVADEALQAELRKPISVKIGLSAEGIDQALAANKTLTKDLQEKLGKSEFWSDWGSGLMTTLKQSMPGLRPTNTTGKTQEQEDVAKGLQEQKTLMMAHADLSVKMAKLKEQELTGDERKAAISKIVLQNEQARNALKLKGLTKEAFDKEENAVDRLSALGIDQENKKADAKQRQLDIDTKIANLAKKGMSAADQKRVRTGLEMQELDKQIAGATSPQDRQQLQLQRLMKGNELRAMAPQANNRAAFGGFSRRWDEQDFQSGNKFMNNSFGSTEQRWDEKGQAEQGSPDVVSELQKLQQIIERAWGES